MKRAVRMALSLMLTVSLAGTGSGMAVTTLAAETEVMAEHTQEILPAAEPGQEDTQGGEVTEIQPRTEPEAGGSTGGESSSGEAGGSIGGESSSGEAGGSTGGDTGSTEASGSTGGDTGSTEAGGSTGGDTGSTEAGGSTGGDTGSTEAGGSTGGDTGSTEAGGSVGGDTGSTETGGSVGGDTGGTENTEKETEKKPNKETEKETSKETEKKPNKETEKKPNKETEKKPDKETEKKPDTEKETSKETEERQPATQAAVIVTQPNRQTEAAVQTEAQSQPDENLLYSEYLGTGEGWAQLQIVADENSTAVDYEMLLVQNAVIICTQSDPVRIQDETQPEELRSLILSGAQLARLAEEKEMEYLMFEVDQAMVAVQLQELLGGDVSKLIALALGGEEEITEETLQLDFASMDEAELSEEQLASVSFEIRVTPSAKEDGSSAYGISVWMHWADQELEISALIPALSIAMDVEGQFTEEEKTDFVMNHAIEWTDESGMVVWKASALVDMPEALISTADGVVERFAVQTAEGSEIPEMEYTEENTLEAHSHRVLMAAFAGPGIYGIS